MAADRAFENQFQWEVDRWVFRRRHRGDPLQVTAEEREWALELHRSRMSRGSRALGALVLGSLVICWPNHLYIVPIIYVGAMLIGMPLLTRWAYDDVIDRLGGAPLLGMPLQSTGRMARRTNGVSMRRLVSALAWLIGIGALFVLDFGGPNYTGPRWMSVATYCIFAATFILLAWMMLLKWAQHERERLRQRDSIAFNRARDLRDQTR